jgi:hypothetical protein
MAEVKKQIVVESGGDVENELITQKAPEGIKVLDNLEVVEVEKPVKLSSSQATVGGAETTEKQASQSIGFEVEEGSSQVELEAVHPTDGFDAEGVMDRVINGQV